MGFTPGVFWSKSNTTPKNAARANWLKFFSFVLLRRNTHEEHFVFHSCGYIYLRMYMATMNWKLPRKHQLFCLFSPALAFVVDFI
jgi:hypothetical protein